MGMGSSSGKSRMALSEINITPLVDVMLVLLIIFMVTAPLSHQGIDIELPETTNSGIQPKDDPTIIYIKNDQSIYIGETKIPYKILKQKLKSIYQTKSKKQIYIQADKKTEYGYVAKVMAEIRSAGILNIGLVTIPKETSSSTTSN